MTPGVVEQGCHQEFPDIDISDNYPQNISIGKIDFPVSFPKGERNEIREFLPQTDFHVRDGRVHNPAISLG